MTEAEWLSADSLYRMLPFVGEKNKRKTRLFTCACCRHLWSLIVHERHRKAVEVGERYADGEASDAERLAALRAVESRVGPGATVCLACVDCDPFAGSRYGSRAATLTPLPGESSRQQEALQAGFLRDIFRPFGSVALTPAWQTDNTVALARAMYELRDFSAMAILADALQEAGCENEDILSHCRGGGPHSRGCWVVDLILGKS